MLNHSITCRCVATLMLLLLWSDDHRTHQPKAAARPSEGAILPAPLHTGAGAHRCPAAPRVVGTSPRLHQFLIKLERIFSPRCDNLLCPLVGGKVRSVMEGKNVLLNDTSENLRPLYPLCLQAAGIFSGTQQRALLKVLLTAHGPAVNPFEWRPYSQDYHLKLNSFKSNQGFWAVRRFVLH